MEKWLELLETLLEIERKMGRTRNREGYQDRPIDLDIIYFNNQVMNDEVLQIPHPRLYNRNFILMPLHEIASDFVDPIRIKPVSELLSGSSDKLTITIYE